MSQLFTHWGQSLISDQPIVASIDGKAVRGCRISRPNQQSRLAADLPATVHRLREL